MSEKSEYPSEKSEMSSAAFVQSALRDHLAPPSLGQVTARIRHAARRLRWSYSRTRDAWYADPRISISADELRAIEAATGLRYGRQELSEIEELISKADALLGDPQADMYRPFIAAIRAFAGALHSSRTEG